MAEVYVQLPIDYTKPAASKVKPTNVRRASGIIGRQYNTRASSVRRSANGFGEATRVRILTTFQWKCQYCGGDASDVDHIIPWTYGGGDEDENLVAACRLCNAIASNKVFDDFEAKRAYIQEERRKRKDEPLNLCVDCKRPYFGGDKGATRFLCAECNQDDLDIIARWRKRRVTP